MSEKREDELRISGLTFDRFWEVLKSTWHVALLLIALIWQIAAYKVSLDTHLQRIDFQLKWLVNHTPHQFYDDPEIQDQQGKPKPQSFYQSPKMADRWLPPSQDAQMPSTFVR